MNLVAGKHMRDRIKNVALSVIERITIDTLLFCSLLTLVLILWVKLQNKNNYPIPLPLDMNI